MESDTGFYCPENNSIAFVCGGKEIMKLDSEGMTYRGKRIEDGGDAHRIFLEVMNQMGTSNAPDTGIGGE